MTNHSNKFNAYLASLKTSPLTEAVRALYESVEDTALTPFDEVIDIAKDSYDRSGGMDYEPEEGEDEESKYAVVKNTVDCKGSPSTAMASEIASTVPPVGI